MQASPGLSTLLQKKRAAPYEAALLNAGITSSVDLLGEDKTGLSQADQDDVKHAVDGKVPPLVTKRLLKPETGAGKAPAEHTDEAQHPKTRRRTAPKTVSLALRVVPEGDDDGVITQLTMNSITGKVEPKVGDRLVQCDSMDEFVGIVCGCIMKSEDKVSVAMSMKPVITTTLRDLGLTQKAVGKMAHFKDAPKTKDLSSVVGEIVNRGLGKDERVKQVHVASVSHVDTCAHMRTHPRVARAHTPCLTNARSHTHTHHYTRTTCTRMRVHMRAPIYSAHARSC